MSKKQAAAVEKLERLGFDYSHTRKGDWAIVMVDRVKKVWISILKSGEIVEA